jgi:hypothetical protein
MVLKFLLAYRKMAYGLFSETEQYQNLERAFDIFLPTSLIDLSVLSSIEVGRFI